MSVSYTHLATLWCTAAIGILASTGMYAMAITAAGILIASNSILRPLARKMNPITAGDEFEKQYRISVICQEAAEQEIRPVSYTHLDVYKRQGCHHWRECHP